MTFDGCMYVLHALAWSGAGVVVGVVLDRTGTALRVLARRGAEAAVVDDGARRRWSEWVVPTVLIVLAAVTAIQGAINERTNSAQDVETARVLQCQVAYANGFADALDARTSASAQAQEALDQVMRVVSQSLASGQPSGSAEVQTAVDQYLEQRLKTKQAQQENPYPAPPRDLCK